MICRLVHQRLHFRSSVTASVATRFHRHSQVIGSAKGTYKERHQQRHHALYPLDDTACLKVCTPGQLRFFNLICLFHENRNKTKSYGHHHSDLMHRHMKLFERAQQTLHGICQLIGRSSQCHNGGSHNQEDKPDPHLDRKTNAFLRNGKDPEMSQLRARCQKQIKSHGDQQKEHDAL